MEAYAFLHHRTKKDTDKRRNRLTFLLFTFNIPPKLYFILPRREAPNTSTVNLATTKNFFN